MVGRRTGHSQAPFCTRKRFAQRRSGPRSSSHAIFSALAVPLACALWFSCCCPRSLAQPPTLSSKLSSRYSHDWGPPPGRLPLLNPSAWSTFPPSSATQIQNHLLQGARSDPLLESKFSWTLSKPYLPLSIITHQLFLHMPPQILAAARWKICKGDRGEKLSCL